MPEGDFLEGGWDFVGGVYVPYEAMGNILEKLNHLRFLADPTNGNPDISLYVDDEDGTLWGTSQPAPKMTRLRRVTRRYIEETYRSVDVDALLRVMP